LATCPTTMEGHGEIRRRRLPHWDLPGATYFVTTCLAGSIPAEGLLDLSRLRAALAKMPCPEGTAQNQWEIDCWKRTFARCDDWLDRQSVVRHFADPTLAAIVAEACHFWAGLRYDLLAYVVMPSHLHWVFQPRDVGQVANLPPADRDILSPGTSGDSCPGSDGQVGNLPHARAHNLPQRKERSPRERIMHTLKLHTARECNRCLVRHGAFWQDESYDHCVRSDDELERIISYVEQNPVKAGLVRTAEQWAFSSARDRIAWDVPVGQPLVRPSARQSGV
jgi:putative transposase